MYRPLAHYGIHFLVPLLIAVFFYKSKWKIVFIILISTMLIDLDHLLVNPIFDPNRCSISFHPLHSYYAIIAYTIMLIPKKTRILAIGLCIHIIADYTDCLLM
jgi:hypothetical protein